jgi:hypothetical protein
LFDNDHYESNYDTRKIIAGFDERFAKMQNQPMKMERAARAIDSDIEI